MVGIVLLFHYLPGIYNYLYGNLIYFHLSKKEEIQSELFCNMFSCFYGLVLCVNDKKNSIQSNK